LRFLKAGGGKINWINRKIINQAPRK
jgi:hypothetical protein